MVFSDYDVMINNLLDFSIPYYLANKLENVLKPTHRDSVEQVKIDSIRKECLSLYNENIQQVCLRFKESDLGKARNSNTDFMQVGHESTLYFYQAYEMFKSVLKMGENSSPLVEYYALLQCIKGIIHLEFDVNEKFFFEHHGLSKESFSDTRPYITAKLASKGVFLALLLKVTRKGLKGFSDIDKYLDQNYKPSLEDVIKQKAELPEIFVGSWLLSNIVRYKPSLWIEILSGRKDDIIRDIRNFRRKEIPRLIESLLKKYDYAYMITSRWGSLSS
ncbi:hypothetical protein ES705_32573 [subsurface metagenome]